MIFCEENIKYPELMEMDPVDISMIEYDDFADQLMGVYESPILGEVESEEQYGCIINDDISGDSLYMLDQDADEFISIYNGLSNDIEGELIDMVFGLHPVI